LNWSQDLKVNFCKSKIGGVGVSEDILNKYAKMLNCNAMILPLTYLRMLIRGNLRKYQTWSGIIEKDE